MAEMQPIIRGIQSVGQVELKYRYNRQGVGGGESGTTGYLLPVPKSLFKSLKGWTSGTDSNPLIAIPDSGISLAGFRLDSEFLRANPQLASAFTIPVLGGGGLSLTNNNRTGVLNVVATKVARTVSRDKQEVQKDNIDTLKLAGSTASAIGVKSDGNYWDLVTIAQIQQAQEGGDSYGASLSLKYGFCGADIVITFEGCTIGTVDPIGLAGNNAADYNIAINYLNWGFFDINGN